MNALNLINSLYKEMRAKIIETDVFYFFIDTSRLQIDTYSKMYWFKQAERKFQGHSLL